MKTVYKYPFSIEQELTIPMPKGAKILHVDLQVGPCIWAEVDTDAEEEPRTFYIVGTGHEIPPGRQHVATFQQPPFVWHLYQPSRL